MLIQIRRWLMQPKVWRFGCFVSSVVGMFCYARSSSFNRLLGKWTWWKILLYTLFSFIICLAIMFTKVWQRSTTLRQKVHLPFIVLLITSVYSFFYDKKVKGKPDANCLLSLASFAIMSLGLARQTHCGFGVDLLYYFCGTLTGQLMKIKLWLFIVGGTFSYSLIILRHSLDARLETNIGSTIQMNSFQANTSVDDDLEDPPENALINPTYFYSGPINSLDMFEVEYGHWVEERDRQNEELKNALQTHASDIQLRLLVENSFKHYSTLFRMKADAAKVDVIYIISGTWTPSAERLLLWIGGFRPSELINIIITQLEPLIDQQLLSINNLRHSSQQTEDALSQGLDQLQQSLVVGNYGFEMAVAMDQVETLESFVHQADLLRQETLLHMSTILTIGQAALGLLAMGDYFHRLRTLSALWTARSGDPPAYPIQHSN